MRTFLLMTLACGLVACSFRQELGHLDDAGVADAWVARGDSGGLPQRACTPPDDGGVLPVIVAVWEGYSDDALPSGADEVKVVIRGTEEGVLSASVIYGRAAPPLPPLTSEECFPKGVLMTEIDSVRPLHAIEGFAYPSSDLVLTDMRLKISYPAWAAWRDWCACQVPVRYSAEGGWGCVPNLGARGGSTFAGDATCFLTDYANSVDIPVPCCKYALCNHAMACRCDEHACVVDTADVLILDLAVNGDRADGTNPWGMGGGVHLRRTQ